MTRALLRGVACVVFAGAGVARADDVDSAVVEGAVVDEGAAVDAAIDEGAAAGAVDEGAAANEGAVDADEGAEPVRAADDEPGLLTDLEMGTFRVDAASPQGKRLGVGLTVGVPTSITAKLMLRPQHAVVASVGAFNGLAISEPSFSLSAAYVWHPVTLARSQAFVLSTHVGGGASLAVLPIPGKRTTIPSALWYRAPTQVWGAARVPVGVDLAFVGAPVDVVFEIAPQVLLFPAVGVGADVALGARVWW